MEEETLVKKFDLSHLNSLDLVVLIMQAMNDFCMRPLSIEEARKLYFAANYHSEMVSKLLFCKLMATVEDQLHRDLVEASHRAMINCNYVGGKEPKRRHR